MMLAVGFKLFQTVSGSRISAAWRALLSQTVHKLFQAVSKLSPAAVFTPFLSETE